MFKAINDIYTQASTKGSHKRRYTQVQELLPENESRRPTSGVFRIKN